MQHRYITLLRLALGLVVTACSTRENADASADAAEHQAGDAKEEDACAEESKTTELTSDSATDVTLEDGTKVLHLGADLGSIEIRLTDRVMDTPLSDEDIARAGLDPASRVELLLEPGDVAFWNLFTVHGSGANTSAVDRRFYLNGYVSAAQCDRGEWAFKGGEPCALGEPVLVHYEELYSRPEPHYVDAR